MEKTLVKNVGITDRLIRFVIGLTLITYPATAGLAIWPVALLATLGGIFLVVAVSAY